MGAAGDEKLLAELSQAGHAVDGAIQAMLASGLSPIAVASALLGGSLCLMSKSMGDEALLRMLENAAAGVRAGELKK
jgi:hypothetical protein